MKESTIKYTESGCEIVYEEIGEHSKRYRVELEKKDGKLITRKIYLKEK